MALLLMVKNSAKVAHVNGLSASGAFVKVLRFVFGLAAHSRSANTYSRVS